MLQTAIAMQTINYIFPFNAYSFPIDYHFVVLTRGRKSLFLKTDVVIPLRSSFEEKELSSMLYKQRDAIKLPPREKLEAFRDYILAAKNTRVALAEDVGKVCSSSSRPVPADVDSAHRGRVRPSSKGVIDRSFLRRLSTTNGSGKATLCLALRRKDHKRDVVRGGRHGSEG